MKTPALCPLDGRYGGRLGALRSVMSEAAFTASRVRAELAWFEVLITAFCGLIRPRNKFIK